MLNILSADGQFKIESIIQKEMNSAIYEYRRESIGYSQDEESFLNLRGIDGWELVSVVYTESGQYRIFYFKRLKGGDKDARRIR